MIRECVADDVMRARRGGGGGCLCGSGSSVAYSESPPHPHDGMWDVGCLSIASRRAS